MVVAVKAVDVNVVETVLVVVSDGMVAIVSVVRVMALSVAEVGDMVVAVMAVVVKRVVTVPVAVDVGEVAFALVVRVTVKSVA